MFDAGDEPPFPDLAPPEVEVLTDKAQEDQNALAHEAIEAIERGDRPLALEKASAAIALGCAGPALYCRRAVILLQLGRPCAAVNDCTAALFVDPDSAKALKTRARALAQLEQWAEAHSDYQQALSIDYDEVTYEESLSVAVKAGEGDPIDAAAAKDEAEPETKTVEEPADEPGFPAMAPSEIEALTEEAQARQIALKEQAAEALEDGDKTLALQKMTEAIALGCASALMYSKRAQILLQLGRARAAIDDCTAALGINPDSGKAFKIRARAHLENAQWAEAYSDFQEALKIDYDDDTYDQCQEVSKKMKEAQARKTPGVEADEGDDEPPFPTMSPADVHELSDDAREQQNTLKQQAADALEDGDKACALEKITAAIALGAASALMYSRRAQILLQLGRPKAAIHDCDAALNINPDSGKSFKIRARAHASLKHWTEAQSDFQTGLKIDYDEGTYEESLQVADKLKELSEVRTQEIATAERVKLELAERQKTQAEKVAASKARLAGLQQKGQDAQEIQAKAAKAAAAEDAQERRRRAQMGPYAEIAERQGWMSDFMGCKRGACKSCSHCTAYTWRPVKLHSCAAANVPIKCLVCGCEPRDHRDLGMATQDDLK